MYKKQNILSLASRRPNQILSTKTSALKYIRGTSSINSRINYPEIKTEEKYFQNKNIRVDTGNFLNQRTSLLKETSNTMLERPIPSNPYVIDKQKQRSQYLRGAGEKEKMFDNLDQQRRRFRERELEWQQEKLRQRQQLEKQQKELQQRREKQREIMERKELQERIQKQNQEKLRRDSSRILSNIKPGGLVGLNNIGNTCYMNSTLQCMFNIPHFNEYFINGRYKNEIKPNGRVADAYGKLITTIRNTSNKSQAPTALKSALGARNSFFAGYSQQDAQELLVCLLETLGEDLSRVNKKSVNYKQLTADTKKHSLQQISDEWWKYYKDRDDSVIFDYFCGQLLSKVICSKCQNQSIAFDNFWDLSLSFGKNEGSTQLSKMIEQFLKEEILSDDYFCSNCKQLRQSKRRFSIYRLPNVLVIQLKRFAYGKFRKQKINTRINFPQHLDLSRFVIDSKDKSVRNPNYTLTGVVNHSGGIDFGHYTAECRNPFTKKWYNFNDSSVSESNLNDRNNYQFSSPYLLFYYRDNQE